MRGINETLRKQAAVVCLLGLTAVGLYLCYLIARPFLGPVVIALMLAIVFYPVHAKMQNRFGRPGAAAIASTTFVLLVVTVPIAALGISVSSELREVVQTLRDQSFSHGGVSAYFSHLGESVLRRLGTFVNLSQFDAHATLLRWAEQSSNYLLSLGAAIVSNVLIFALDTVVVFFTLFFFFREGKNILESLVELLPFSADQTDKLFGEISRTMIANLYGGLAVGVAQGTLTGLSFWALGLSAPVMWALVTALASLVPVVGSALVWGPAVMLLLLTGHWIKALLLFGWGAVVVGQIDAFVRPYVVSARVKVHPLLVFFALLGGVKAFGVIGIFVGPVVLSITLATLEMLKKTDFSWQSNAPGSEYSLTHSLHNDKRSD
jgi:predicted PurR-regulated permease PerM